MAKYRTKIVEIEAIGWNGKNQDKVKQFCPTMYEKMVPVPKEYENPYSGGLSVLALIIPTLEGDMIALPGDFIIKGLRGEFYPCKPDVFHKKYEEI